MMPITPRCCWGAYIIVACFLFLPVNGCGKERPYIQRLKNDASLNQVPKKVSSPGKAIPGPSVLVGNLRVTFVESVKITKAPESPSPSTILFDIIDKTTGASCEVYIKAAPLYPTEPRGPMDPRSIVTESVMETVGRYSLGDDFWSEYKSPWDLHYHTMMATPALLEQKTGRDRQQLLGELILKDVLPSPYGYWEHAGFKAVFTTFKDYPSWTTAYLYDSKGAFLGTIFTDQDATSDDKESPELEMHKLLFSVKPVTAQSKVE